MKVSAVTENTEEEKLEKAMRFQANNKFISATDVEKPAEPPVQEPNNRVHGKLGIENLQEFTIFPKQVIDGKTVITA